MIVSLAVLLAITAGCLAAAAAIAVYFRSRFYEAEKKLHAAEQKLDQVISEDREQKFAIAEKSISLLELKEKLEEEQEKTSRLLRNILPEKIIEQLQKYGYAKPELFENVTVFFSDISDFTTISSKLDPVVLIDELSDIFGHFDEIFVRHGCERIKTIGDAYMSVSGLPVPDQHHCENIINAAREAMQYLKQRNREKSHCWQMRMGINSGSVVAGIVGTNKYIYDLFGDTVNTAARMEQYGEKMRINLSETARKLAGDKFKFIERNPIEVQGKGKMIMYFLDDSGDLK